MKLANVILVCLIFWGTTFSDQGLDFAVKDIGKLEKMLRQEIIERKSADEKIVRNIEQRKTDTSSDFSRELKRLSYTLDSLKISLDREEWKPDEAMEIGGIVTVDYANHVGHSDNHSLEIGTVELSANVKVGNDILASVTLLAEGDLGAISIDQAVASYDSPKLPLNIVFGQHVFNHGMLSTHLISDPSMIDYVELSNPGLTANYAFGHYVSGAAFTVIQGSDGRNCPAGVLNFDYIENEKLQFRISTLFTREMSDVDIALDQSWAKISMDAEIFTQVDVLAGEKKLSGYLLGFGYSLFDFMELAVRYDGVSSDSFKKQNRRYAGGLTVGMKDGIFFAVEYSQTEAFAGTKNQEVALQIGLESNLKLPGFQRKTLTRNNR